MPWLRALLAFIGLWSLALGGVGIWRFRRLLLERGSVDRDGWLLITIITMSIVGFGVFMLIAAILLERWPIYAAAGVLLGRALALKLLAAHMRRGGTASA